MPTPVNLELRRSGRIFDHLLVLNLFASLEDDRGNFIKRGKIRFPYWNVSANPLTPRVGYGNLSSRIGTQQKTRGSEGKPTTQEAEPVASSLSSKRPENTLSYSFMSSILCLQLYWSTRFGSQNR